MIRIPQGVVIDDEVHGKQFRIEKLLGAGGFGTAYRAVELNAQGGVRRGSETCLKFSAHGDEWHAEVYFSGMLRDVGHVVRMQSAFPTHVMVQRRKRLLFCIETELVQTGSVSDLCDAGFRLWTEAQVQHRVRQLLKPLSLLHGMNVSHRDVTPGNVFVGNQQVLKLGDFGISKAQLNVAGVDADVFAPYYAPPQLGRWWLPADDVYQVGLLMCTLLTGTQVGGGIGLVEVNQFTEKGKVRDAIKASLKVRAQRPKTAAQLGAMLSK